MIFDFVQATKNASLNQSGRKFPNRDDSRCQDGLLFPEFKPSFKLEPGAAIFTIGSCFARNIEEALLPLGFKLPTASFSVPKSEWPARPNGLLNEYNPGTIAQRIDAALTDKHFPDETIVASGLLHADLMLLGTAPDVSFERIKERRQEIFKLYQNLPQCPYVVITLGFIEAWFDNQTQLFINRLPPNTLKDREPNRFVLKILTVKDSLALLEPAVDALCQRGCKTILTVSPVPIKSTFSKSDCVTANEYSKAVLRVCAEEICTNFNNVDYFPSFEIVRSGGLINYMPDNIHVKSEVVQKITALMCQKYSEI